MIQSYDVPIITGPGGVFPCAQGLRVQIPETMYREVLDRLYDAIDGNDYFSGTICFTAADLDCRLTIALIVYRRRVSYPEGAADEIDDLVPVWWEFHTVRDGDELPNDFQFSELKKQL